MNDKRRAKLRDAVGYLNMAAKNVGIVHDEEEDSLNNMPESLEGTDRYSEMEDNVDLLEDIADDIDRVIGSITSIKGV